MTKQDSNDDFFQQMGDVKPLQQDKVVSKREPESPLNAIYRQKVAQSFPHKDGNFLTDGEVELVDSEAILEFKLDGIQPGVFKKLRQGKYPIDFHLDLHRKTVAEARNDIYHLLRGADKANLRSLLITHGKGARSSPPARLKSYVNHWLRQVDIVIAFHSARPQHGSAGSVYVLLKKPKDPEQINQSKFT